MKVVRGDLLELADNNVFDVIIHGCNCFCTMGAGIAKSIRMKYPEVYLRDKNTVIGDKTKLGTISYVKYIKNNREFIVVNAYTQYDYRGHGVKVNYDAVRKCFNLIKNNFSGLRFGIPKIGAGLAGGTWKIIESIIDEEMKNEDITLVVLNSY